MPNSLIRMKNGDEDDGDEDDAESWLWWRQEIRDLRWKSVDF